MRGCFSVEEIAQYATGASAITHDELTSHLETCATCRSYVVAAVRAARGSGPVAPAAALLGIGDRVGRYVVVGWLGAGGMGHVYAAYDPELDRKIALKLVRGDVAGLDTARLAREAQLAARLSHPNVVAVYDVGSTGSQIFIALELVDGQTLTEWLREPRDWPTIVKAFQQATAGLVAAHAAGLVHRDIKPDNLLVGRDGRVRVSDFGLARLGDDHEPGAIVGTPAYMAPEQRAGRASDARSDQYSLCVTLYEALCGARPRTPLVWERDVPGWIKPVIARGLAEDPEQRYASTTELAAALAPPASKRRRVIVAIGTALVAGSVLLAATARATADPCTGAARELQEIWNPGSRFALRTGFARLSVPYGIESWRTVDTTLDDFATRWIDLRTEACRATRVDKHQSEALLDLQTSCLDREKRELAATLAALEAPTVEVAQRAVAMTQSLSQPAACADLDALRSELPPPPNPVTASLVAAIEGQLAAGLAELRAGRIATATPVVTAAADRAATVDYAPLAAAAWLARAELATTRGAYGDAETALDEARWAARRGRDRRAELVAWIRSVELVGGTRARLADGARLARDAEAALAGYGADRELSGKLALASAHLYKKQGDYARAKTAMLIAQKSLAATDQIGLGTILQSIGNVDLALGDYDAAQSDFERSLEILQRVLGAHHPEVARAMMGLGNVDKDRENYERALARYHEASKIFDETLPASHPYRGAIEGDIALVLLEQKKIDEALAHQHVAVDLLTRGYGAQHPEVGLELNNIGLTLDYAKRGKEAIPYFEQARAIFIAAYGPHHETIAMIDHNEALAYRNLKELDQAEAHERAAIALREELTPDHPELARAYRELGVLMTLRNRYAEAAALLERTIAIFTKVHGPDTLVIAKDLLDLGWTRNQQQKFADAIPPLEHALKIRALETPPQPDYIAYTEFELAKALIGANRDHDRAIELATRARDGLPKAQADDIGEMTAWIKAHK